MEDTKTNKTLVNVVLDRSGSMGSTRTETIKGFNAYLASLRGDGNTEYSITMIQFDSPVDGPELTVKYVDKPLGEVIDLTEADYEPRGWTPLYDAIGECIRRVETKDRSVLTVIITDGMENASKEFTREAIKALIAEKEKEHWTFAFLGADIDSYAVGASMGMSFDNTSNYVKGNESALYASLATSTVERSAMASSVGLNAAAAYRMFDDSKRAAMGGLAGTTAGGAQPDPVSTTTGGRPAAPPPFPTRKPQPVQSRKRTAWKTSV